MALNVLGDTAMNLRFPSSSRDFLTAITPSKYELQSREFSRANRFPPVALSDLCSGGALLEYGQNMVHFRGFPRSLRENVRIVP
jgi:hypothetical protein